MTPSEFLTQHNPDVGLAIERRGITAGQLALNSAAPTLGHVAEIYGEGTAIVWLKVQLQSVDVVLGANSFSEQALMDGARLLLAKNRDVTVVNLLQFFTRYKAGEYVEKVERVGGMQKILTALRYYTVTMNDDARRVERERREREAYEQRLEWEKKACSYDDYKKQRENAEEKTREEA